MPPASSSEPRSCWPPMSAAAMSRLLAPWWWETRPSIAPSGASWRAISNGRSPESRVLERSASSPARKKPFWWQPPAPSLLRGAPAGHWGCWLAEMVKLTDHESLSHETVRRRLAENHLKPWRKDMWCIPRVDGEYVARMEDVLDLYAETPDSQRPVVCFDESPVQLIGEVRQPIPAAPGQLERYDYEYRRN